MTTPAPSPMKVYVVIGTHDYESSSVLRVYRNKVDADAIVAQCYEHKQSEPRFEGRVQEATDEYLAEHAKLDQAWRDSLPFAPHDYDFYNVQECEVIE